MTVSLDTFQWHIIELEKLEKYCEDIELAIPKEHFINLAQDSQESFYII